MLGYNKKRAEKSALTLNAQPIRESLFILPIFENMIMRHPHLHQQHY
jgi:hypothetical protein